MPTMRASSPSRYSHSVVSSVRQTMRRGPSRAGLVMRGLEARLPVQADEHAAARLPVAVHGLVVAVRHILDAAEHLCLGRELVAGGEVQHRITGQGGARIGTP